MIREPLNVGFFAAKPDKRLAIERASTKIDK